MCSSYTCLSEKLDICVRLVATPQSSCECSHMEHLLVKAGEDFPVVEPGPHGLEKHVLSTTSLLTE